MAKDDRAGNRSEGDAESSASRASILDDAEEDEFRSARQFEEEVDVEEGRVYPRNRSGDDAENATSSQHSPTPVEHPPIVKGVDRDGGALSTVQGTTITILDGSGDHGFCSDARPLHELTADVERPEEGFVEEAEARIVADDSSVASRYLWERLPVATPVFDADVAVWEYERPNFRKRFGRGLYGDRPVQPADDDGAREPIFTEEDRSNPLRCVCKIVGIVLALPLYLLYLTFVKCVWVVPFCRAADCVIVRPVGWLIDFSVYAIKNAAWAAYRVILVPIYTALVYCARILRNCSLFLAKCVLLPIEWAYRRIVAPAIRMVNKIVSFICAKVASFFSLIYNKVLLPCVKCVRRVVRAVCDAAGSCLRFVWKQVKKTMNFVYEKLILPCARCIWKGMRAVGTAMKSTFRLACKGVRAVCDAITSALRFVWRQVEKMGTSIWKWVISPCYEGFKSGVAYSYKHVILPLGSCLWRYLVRPFCDFIRWMYRTAVKCTKALYKFIVLPLFHLARGAIKSFHSYILAPLGRLLRSIAAAIKSGAVATGRVVNECIFTPLGRFVGNVAAGVASLFRAAKTAVRNVFHALGRAISALFGR